MLKNQLAPNRERLRFVVAEFTHEMKNALPESCSDLFWSRLRVFEDIVKDCGYQNVRVLNLSKASEQARNLDRVIHVRHTARPLATLLAVALRGKLERSK